MNCCIGLLCLKRKLEQPASIDDKRINTRVELNRRECLDLCQAELHPICQKCGTKINANCMVFFQDDCVFCSAQCRIMFQN